MPRLEARDLEGADGEGREKEGGVGETTVRLRFSCPHPHILPTLLQLPPHPAQATWAGGGERGTGTDLGRGCGTPSLPLSVPGLRLCPLPWLAYPLALWGTAFCLTPSRAPTPHSLTPAHFWPVGLVPNPKSEPHSWASSYQWTNTGVQYSFYNFNLDAVTQTLTDLYNRYLLSTFHARPCKAPETQI